MLVIHPIQELLRAWPALIGLVVAGTAGGHGSWWSLGGALAVVVAGMLRWVTTTYRISAEPVQVRKGLVRRRLLTVPRDRIRTVDVTANALHRSLGLAKVEVGTGRTDRKDDAVKLDALHADEATRLREELLHRAPARTAEPQCPRETLIARVPPEWVRYGPFTLTGLVTVGVIAGVAGRAVNEAHIDPGRLGPVSTLLDRWEHAAVPVEIAVFAVALMVAVAVASTLGYVLAFYKFRLTRNTAGTLHVTRGLITTRSITIEERRLRGVELSEPLLLRLARGARCLAITTGLRVGRGAERGGSLLLPPGPREEARRGGAQGLGPPPPPTRPPTPPRRPAPPPPDSPPAGPPRTADLPADPSRTAGPLAPVLPRGGRRRSHRGGVPHPLVVGRAARLGLAPLTGAAAGRRAARLRPGTVARARPDRAHPRQS